MKQKKFIDQIDKKFSSIAEWSINNRMLVIILSLVMLVSGVFFMTKLRFDGSLESMFSKSDQVYASYLDYLEDFESDEITYILYRVPDKQHGPFDIDAMRTIANLTEELENSVPFVKEATSLTNVEFMFAEGDLLIVDELMINFPDSQEKLLDIKNKVMKKPIYVDYLINKGGDYAAIFLEMTAASPDPLEEIIHDPALGETLTNLYPQASDIKIREILAKPEYAGSGIEFFLTGDVPMNAAYNYLYTEDTAKISLLTLVLIALVSFLLFRTSLVGLLAPISVVILSVIMMMGVIGMFGWSVGMFITMAPSLICAIGVAQAVHILQEYKRSLAYHGDKSLAVKESISKVGGPCLLAALTTAAGFLVMGVSSLQGLAEFGIYAAIGVAFTFILSITLLVVFLSGKKSASSASSAVKTPQEQPRLSTMNDINPFVAAVVETSIKLDHKYPKLILTGFALVFLWSFVGLTKLNIDFNFIDEFEDHVQWKIDTLLADEVMGGILSLSYIIDTKTEGGVKNPELLKAIDNMQQFAESMPLVKKTFSIADFVKDINQTFNADDPAFYRIPDDPALVSQYLLVYELSGGDELFEVTTPDYERTVVDMRVVMTEASNMREIINQIDAYVAENPIPGAELRPTGIGYLWVRIGDYVSDTQMATYSLIFLIITLVMMIAYGSIKIGLLSMIPNLTPIVITLGAMGWLGISLDYMKLLLATIAIGIAVDDTIHLVTRFRSRFYQLGNYSDALTASLRDVGPALVITTIILIVGFGGYFYTDLHILTVFGVLLGSTIALALAADLLLMPVIFTTLKPFGKETNPSPSTSLASDVQQK